LSIEAHIVSFWSFMFCSALGEDALPKLRRLGPIIQACVFFINKRRNYSYLIDRVFGGATRTFENVSLKALTTSRTIPRPAVTGPSPRLPVKLIVITIDGQQAGCAPMAVPAHRFCAGQDAKINLTRAHARVV
jgi:hypothetical protein